MASAIQFRLSLSNSFLVLGERPILVDTGSPIIEKVSLEVFATNAGAIRLYEQLGFVQAGLRPREIKFGPGRYVDGMALYKFVKQQHTC